MKQVRHIGFRVERCRHGLLERVFAEKWLAENAQHRHSGGVLQTLFLRPDSTGRHYRPARLFINRRDAFVAATVVQWLGTNVGYGFLTDCLKRAGLVILDKDRYEVLWSRERSNNEPSTPGISDQYYALHTQQGYEVNPGAWFNHIQPFTWKPMPPIAEKRKPLRQLQLMSKFAQMRKEADAKIAKRKERDKWLVECEMRRPYYGSNLWC